MRAQPFRSERGGLIDRNEPRNFEFDGRALPGFAGDTLASALLANGIRLVGRSFKYHRRRGIVGAGSEEPNALVRIGRGARAEPNLKATQVELYDGLVAESQNRWPNLEFDVGALANWFGRFLPAGFYYKTFMGPGFIDVRRRWLLYEPHIRRAAGLGRAATQPDPDRYEHRYDHCDVLVVGAGPAGLAAALAAARSGARVVLIEEQPHLGGRLLATRSTLDDAPAMDWVAACTAELTGFSNLRVLTRTSAFGYYDQNLIGALERVTDHLAEAPPFAVRHRRWMIRAGEVIVATGALERPLVFPGNDMPGVMLASAAQTYANQFAVRCGQRCVVFTNNDSAYPVVHDLVAAGVTVKAVVDVREGGPAAPHAERLRAAGVETRRGAVVVETVGPRRLNGVRVARLDGRGGLGPAAFERIGCDLLVSAGGWNPTAHLFSQSRARLQYEEAIGAFVPGEPVQATRAAGAVTGDPSLQGALSAGAKAGRDAARRLGHRKGRRVKVPACIEEAAAPIQLLWSVPRPPGWHTKAFVDLQNDVSVDDVSLAVRENYQSVEHLKRYTTLGMGTDQGRTSNVVGLALLAEQLGKPVPEVGHTTFRPPYSPISLGAMAGTETGHHLAPVRHTPMHAWHAAQGAPFVPAGHWQRAQAYPREGETLREAYLREARHVRQAVGLVDVSTLGKIMVQGPDAAAFLERVYINRWKSLKVGRCRYGIMLREDGFILDDGTTTRVADNSYYMTTTTGHAGPVMSHLEYYAQVVWPELRVHLTSVTDQWGGMALAGPAARAVLAAALDDTDVSDAALPFMGFLESRVAGARVWVFRMTFSGELAFEVHTGADDATAVWEALMAAGERHDIVPYGTEAMGILRIEKGHVVASELDGRSVPADFGFERMMRTDSDFIGRRSLERPGLRAAGRRRLVGLMPVDGVSPIPRGGHLVRDGLAPPPVATLGHVTSTAYSPNVGGPIALALLAGDVQQEGQTLYAAAPLTNTVVPVEVCDPVFIDPEGKRPRG